MGKSYFGSGWLFILPYFIIYLLAAELSLPVHWVRTSFWILHIGNLCGLPLFLSRLKGREQPQRKELLFWFLLALFFLIPGAYMEFPSDPWEHFYRISAWQNYELIKEYPYWKRFPYFWNSTFINLLPIPYKKFGLDLISAFWQLLLAYHYCRFISIFEKNRSWQQIHTFAFAITFGTNLFSFRYYALSGTMLAYCAYLATLAILLSIPKTTKSALLSIIPLLIVMRYSHGQTLVFFGISLLTIAVYRTWATLTKVNRENSLAYGTFFIGLMLIVGIYLSNFQSHLYHRMTVEPISILGTFQPWKVDSRIFQTFGIPGMIALVLSPFAFRQAPALATLTWAPLLLLIFPPSVLVIAKFFNPDTPYRILYAMPFSPLLVMGIRSLLQVPFLNQFVRPMLVLPMTLILILLIATPYQHPWRGRLFFQTYRPHRDRTLAYMAQTAEWFANFKKMKPDCFLFTDDFTSFGLAAYLGRQKNQKDGFGFIRYTSRRLAPHPFSNNAIRFLTEFISYESFKNGWTQAASAAFMFPCGILVPNFVKIPPTPRTVVGESSGHWPSQYGDMKWVTGEFEQIYLDMLTERGWMTYDVPPFFTYYSPPNRCLPPIPIRAPGDPFWIAE